MSELAWKDSTSYSQSDKERIPTCFETRLPSGLRIIITNGHIYYKGEWIMHCYDVCIKEHLLNVNTQEEAKDKSVATVRALVKKWHDELGKI